jgi:glycosyltransferase involved in cell wall biosynthesis
MMNMHTPPQRQILFINRSHWQSQAANAVQQINTAHALACRGARVEYVVLATGPTTADAVLARYGLAPNPNLTIVPILVPEPARWRAQLFLLKAAARVIGRRLTQPSTLLLTRESRLLLLARALRSPAVLEAHDLGDLGFRFNISESTRRRHQQAIRRALGVVTVTRAGAHEIGRVCAVAPDRIVVAPDAAEPRAMQAPQASLDIDAPLRVAYAGSMWPDRGVETLMLALPELTINARLFMVGGGQEQIAFLQGRAAQLGVAEQLEFVGHVPHHDVAGWLERSDVLVLPIRPGAWADKYASPMKLFEYMATGRPMIVADVPTVREIVDEHSATFFRPDDAGSLARALEQIAANWEHALARAERARSLLEQQYTYKHRAQRILDWLETIEKLDKHADDSSFHSSSV